MSKISASFAGKTDSKLSYKTPAQPFALHAASNLLKNYANFFFFPSNGGTLMTLPLSSILDSFSNFKFQILFDHNSCALQIISHQFKRSSRIFFLRLFPSSSDLCSSFGLCKSPLSSFPRCGTLKYFGSLRSPLSNLSSSSYF